MHLIQTDDHFSLDAVKPLEPLLQYRQRAMELTRQALSRGLRPRERSPVTGAALSPWGEVDGFSYGLCRESGSRFLTGLSDSESWGNLLAQVSRLRHGPEGFHGRLAQSRTDHVYAPKLEWIEDTLRFEKVRAPRLLEAATPPSVFTPLLKESRIFSEVQTLNEMNLAHGRIDGEGRFQAAVLLESLDRVDDPRGLVEEVGRQLEKDGLLFLTGLVSSGFDFTVLGLQNLYLYPPDRTNVFSLQGLTRMLTQAGFGLLEVSTPGVLDLEVVRAHQKMERVFSLSGFERQLLEAEPQTREAFQSFLQEQRMSSFARIVARRIP